MSKYSIKLNWLYSVSFYFGFRHNFSIWEMMKVASLLSLLEGYSFRDVRIWNPNPSEGFSCISFFRLLLDPSLLELFVFDIVWRIKIPMKVRFFIWQVLLGRVSTGDRLVRRRTTLVEPLCCILCRKAEEDMNHLFWDCQYTRTV